MDAVPSTVSQSSFHRLSAFINPQDTRREVLCPSYQSELMLRSHYSIGQRQIQPHRINPNLVLLPGGGVTYSSPGLSHRRLRGQEA